MPDRPAEETDPKGTTARTPQGTDDPPTAAPPTTGAQPREAKTPDEIAERKRMRRWLLNAYKNENYAEAVRIGNELRVAFVIDWEAHFVIAQSERLTGQHDKAIDSYERFFATYPDNFRADDARYQAAILHAEAGNKGRARALFKQVAADESSDLRAKAAARLRR